MSSLLVAVHCGPQFSGCGALGAKPLSSDHRAAVARLALALPGLPVVRCELGIDVLGFRLVFSPYQRLGINPESHWQDAFLEVWAGLSSAEHAGWLAAEGEQAAVVFDAESLAGAG
jgi:hypothetical protein